ncbi:hypothetical protein [Tautonia marina]|uniref:hypothetical protein n=1 Tax=Tautonia marina TaxID=2653855 RepID=UPI0013760AF4|nr:hypothetical protein [Tautonia marina]
MLATDLGLFDPPSDVEPISLAVPGQTINLWELETPDVVIDQVLDTPPEHSRVTMSFPWRVTSWLKADELRPGDRPSFPEEDFPSTFDPDAARVLPSDQEILWKGSIVSGNEGQMFRISLAPGTRAINFSYAVRFEDRFDANVAALRVSLRDAEGALIDSWWLDASVDRVDARLLALIPAEEATFYLGIEAVGPPSVSDTPIPYALNVRPAVHPPGNWFPGPGPGQSQVESPVFGDETLSQVVPFFGEVARFHPPILLSLDASRGTDFSTMEVASGRETAMELIAGEPGISSAFEGGLIRPLPTQSASTVGGFLATGPDIRGERDVPDRFPRIDEFADPLLMASNPVTEGSGESDRFGIKESPDQVGESSASGSVAELTVIPIELAPEAAGPGMTSVADAGSLPLFVAGLRTTRGTPSILSGEHCSPPIPDDLAALVAATDPPAPVNTEQQSEDPPEEDPDPTRPRVLRTALVGVAALAVGLLLPDLTSERTLIRLRSSPARARWWFFG